MINDGEIWFIQNIILGRQAAAYQHLYDLKGKFFTKNHKLCQEFKPLKCVVEFGMYDLANYP